MNIIQDMAKKHTITKSKDEKDRLPSIYMDYASITPISKIVSAKTKNFLSGGMAYFIANPSSNHELGISSRETLEKARREIATNLSVQRDEIVFTSGATEGNNLSLKGIVLKAREDVDKPRVITSSIEHSSILSPLRELHSLHIIELIEIEPTDKNIIDLADLEKNLSTNTVLIAFSHVNSETGDITNPRDLRRVVQKWKEKNKINNHYPYIHIDASQSSVLLDICPHNIGADVVVFDGAKMYSHRGSGFMFISRKVKIKPILSGGGQEKGIRPGTENVIAAIALSESLKEILKLRSKEYDRIEKLRDNFISLLEKKKINFSLNSVRESQKKVIPSILNICIKDIGSEFTVVALSQRGVHASAASACESRNGEGISKVIERIKNKKDCASSSIRFSFGRYTTLRDVKSSVERLCEVIQSNPRRKF